MTKRIKNNNQNKNKNKKNLPTGAMMTIQTNNKKLNSKFQPLKVEQVVRLLKIIRKNNRNKMTVYGLMMTIKISKNQKSSSRLEEGEGTQEEMQ